MLSKIQELLVFRSFLTAILIALSTPSSARMPEFTARSPASTEWVKADGKYLWLNGKATHSVFIFNVYEISLFLEKRSSNPEDILRSNTRKAIFLKFLRNVRADQLRETFTTNFFNNCAPQCDELKPAFQEMSNKIPDLSDGDTLQLWFLPSGVQLRSSQGIRVDIPKPALNRVLLSLWLGNDPPSEGLKKNILGLTD